jgi:hypothetical protein
MPRHNEHQEGTSDQFLVRQYSFVIEYPSMGVVEEEGDRT